MDRETYLAALQRDGHRLARAAEKRLGEPVGQQCPGWTLAEVVWHTGRVHHFWHQLASGAIARRDDYEPPPRPPEGELVGWFRDGVERLARFFAAADLETPVWTWAQQKNVGFVLRRVAQETAVHRWDAQHATGPAEPIEAELAADGIDEFFDFVLPARAQKLNNHLDGVGLQASDLPRTWVVRVTDGAVGVERDGATAGAPAGARGSASDLLLLLWRRRRPDDVEVEGDRSILQHFLALADLS